MTLQYNSNMSGGYCIRFAVQESHGAGYGEPTIDSTRIPETIPRMYSPKSSVPMDRFPPHFSARVAKMIIIELMNEQQDMEAVSDAKPSLPIPSNIQAVGYPGSYR